MLYLKTDIDKKEQFSEIYFLDHRDLPDTFFVNESKSISFLIGNDYQNSRTYYYEVDSSLGNLKEEVFLLPGESVVIDLEINVGDVDWQLNTNFTYSAVDILEDDYEVGLIDSPLSAGSLLPISYEIPGFGKILHSDLVDYSFEKPFNVFESSSYLGKNIRKESYKNITLWFDGENLNSETIKREKVNVIVSKPFIIKFYAEGESQDKILDIYFWYEII